MAARMRLAPSSLPASIRSEAAAAAAEWGWGWGENEGRDRQPGKMDVAAGLLYSVRTGCLRWAVGFSTGLPSFLPVIFAAKKFRLIWAQTK
jgi:hypothetical protein